MINKSLKQWIKGKDFAYQLNEFGFASIVAGYINIDSLAQGIKQYQASRKLSSDYDSFITFDLGQSYTFQDESSINVDNLANLWQYKLFYQPKGDILFGNVENSYSREVYLSGINTNGLLVRYVVDKPESMVDLFQRRIQVNYGE